MTNRYASVPAKDLNSDLTSVGTNFKLKDIQDWGGQDLTAAAFSDTQTWVTFINDARTLVEFMLVDTTTIPNATTTGIDIVARGLKYYADGTVNDSDEVTANKLSWTAQETKVLLGTNPPFMYGQLMSKENDETITGKKTFPGGGDPNAPVSGTSYTVPTDPLEYTSMQYVDTEIAAVIAGAIPAFSVSQDGADPSLNIQVQPGTFMNGNAPTAFLGTSGFPMAPSSINYVMLSSDNVVVSNTTGFLDDHLSLATVTTDPTDIISIMDERSWLTLATDDQGISKTFTYGDTIAVGDVLYLDSADAKWKLADATAAATADTSYGVALEAGVDNDTGKRVQVYGVVQAISGTIAAGDIFLSDTPGEADSTPGTYRRFIGFSPDGTNVVLAWGPDPSHFSGASTNVTSDNLNTLVDNDDATGLHFHPALIQQLVAGETINGDPEPQAVRLDQITGEVFVAEDTGFLNEAFGTIGFAITDATAANPVDVAMRGNVNIASKTLVSGVASHQIAGPSSFSGGSLVTIDLANHLTEQIGFAFLTGGETGNLEKIEFQMVGSVGNSVDCVIDIYAYDQTTGEPTGPSLATSSTENKSSSGFSTETFTFAPFDLQPNTAYVGVMSFSNYVGGSTITPRGSSTGTSTQQRIYQFPSQFGSQPKSNTTTLLSSDSGASWTPQNNTADFAVYTTQEQYILGAPLYLGASGSTSLTGSIPVGKLVQDTLMQVYDQSKLIASDIFEFQVFATSGSGSTAVISVPSNTRRIEIDIIADPASATTPDVGSVTLTRGQLEDVDDIGDYDIDWSTSDYTVTFTCNSNEQTVFLAMRFFD